MNPLPKEAHVTYWCADETIRFLEASKDSTKPYFLGCSFVKPHVPYDCPEHLKGFYDPDEMPGR